MVYDVTLEERKRIMEIFNKVISSFDNDKLLKFVEERDPFSMRYGNIIPTILNNEEYRNQIKDILDKYGADVLRFSFSVSTDFFLLISEVLRRKLLKISEIFGSNIRLDINNLDSFNEIIIDDELKNELIKLLNKYLMKIDDKYLNFLFKNIKSLDLQNKKVNENIDNNELIEIGKILYTIDPRKFDNNVRNLIDNYLSLLYSKNLNKEYNIEEKEEILYPFKIKYKVRYLKDKDGKIVQALIDNLVFNVKKFPLRYMDNENYRIFNVYSYNINKYEIETYRSVVNLHLGMRKRYLNVVWTDEYILYRGKLLYVTVLEEWFGQKFIRKLYDKVILTHVISSGTGGSYTLLEIPSNELEILKLKLEKIN